MNNGFVYVASLNYIFIKAARYSAQSLKDYWPEAHITLFTHEEWVTEDDKNLFDNIITKDVPYHVRAKLWALDKTPYDLTCYMDCDTQVEHEDIQYIFDQHDSTSNISLSKARDYAASIDPQFPVGKLTDHCGLFIYDNKPKTLTFMKQWWEHYAVQVSQPWPHDTKEYPNYLKPWDMFTFWWLQNKTKYAIKRSYWPEPDAKWNFIMVYKEEELMGHEIVISHRPVPRRGIEKVFSDEKAYYQ